MQSQMRDLAEIRREMVEHMADNGISARQIMRDTGISHVTVNKFLRGIGRTQTATVVKLCRHLSLSWHKEDA